jgi:hypothetical protein
VPIAAKTYDLCVRRTVLSPISDADADDVLQRATTLMHKQSSPACRAVTMARQGSVELLDGDLSNEILTDADFRRVTADHCVNVVNKILWCGADLVKAYPHGALGCGNIASLGTAVVRTYRGMTNSYNHGVEPITWLHELGHNEGMVHNSQDSRDVMTAGLDVTTNQISTPECNVFDGVTKLKGHPQIAAAEAASPSPRVTREPIEAFVRHNFAMGFPINQAKEYAGQEKRALALLDDPAFTASQSAIIALLGIIGTPASIPRLTKLMYEFVPTGSDDDHIDALLAAPIAIGTIANRYHLPPRDFEILREAAKPVYWTKRVVVSDPVKSGQGDYTAEQIDDMRVDSLVRQLSSQSLKGYALTGYPSIDLTLQANSSQVAAAAIPAREKQDRVEQIKEAISLNRKSRQVGAMALIR